MTEPTDQVPATPPGRIEVVGGGVPTDAELAALVVALTPVAGPPTSAGRGDPVPAWARAALLEGLGYPIPTRPSDLTAATRFG